jgi:hypothetical protein
MMSSAVRLSFGSIPSLASRFSRGSGLGMMPGFAMQFSRQLMSLHHRFLRSRSQTTLLMTLLLYHFRPRIVLWLRELCLPFLHRLVL